MLLFVRGSRCAYNGRMTPESRIGMVIAGRFRITGLIGEGGMGTVYMAEHRTLPRRFAIKILKREMAEDPVFVERFRREAIAASRVVHPNVVYITDFGRLDQGDYYMVMEYLEGDELERILERHGRLPLSRVLHIVIQLSDALDHAHSMGVVHRDLKLENVLLCRIRGRDDVVKLVDFGIAEILDPDEESKRKASIPGQVFGTPEYMSPEQATDQPQDGRSDIYAMGVLAFELAVGEPPFTGEPTQILLAHLQRPPPLPSSRLPGIPVPKGFDACVLRCLAKKPEERYQRAAELRRDLMRLRGMLSGMTDDFLYESALSKHPAFHEAAQGPWRSIGDLEENVYSPFDPPFTGEASPLSQEQGEEKRRSVIPSALTRSSNELRAELHMILKELALSLSEAAIRPKKMTEIFHSILQIEEEEAALRAQIALLDQNYERIRFESGERETMLRYAVLDLTLERTQLLEKTPNPSPEIVTKAEDLAFQIAELENRLMAVFEDRHKKIEALNLEILEYRTAEQERTESAARLYNDLHETVKSARTKAQGPPFDRLYGKIEEIREELNSLRRSATTPR